MVYDYTPTRGRAGPAKFLEGYTGYVQADANSVYDAFFKPARGLTEVGCWLQARRYVFKALETDAARLGPALPLIARWYAVEDRAKALSLSAEQRLVLRKRVWARLLEKLHQHFGGVAAGGFAEESVGRGGALRVEPVGRPHPFSGRR